MPIRTPESIDSTNTQFISSPFRFLLLCLCVYVILNCRICTTSIQRLAAFCFVFHVVCMRITTDDQPELRRRHHHMARRRAHWHLSGRCRVLQQSAHLSFRIHIDRWTREERILSKFSICRERERERRCLSRCPSRNPCPNWITPLYCTTTRKDECGFLTGTQLHHSSFNSIGLMIILLHAHMLYVGPARAGPTRVQTFACTPSN